jgi:hypothetical protein
MSLPTLFFIVVTLFMMIEVSLFFLNSKEGLIRTQYNESCASAVANAGYVQAMQASVLVEIKFQFFKCSKINIGNRV